jgi:hypothetical protein
MGMRPLREKKNKKRKKKANETEAGSAGQILVNLPACCLFMDMHDPTRPTMVMS